MKKRKINVGDKFGMLSIIKEVEQDATKGGNKVRKFRCICDCGKEKDIRLPSLVSGHTSSCGCIQAKNARKHSMSGERIYNIWKGIKYRCDNINGKYYSRYGGRGISYDKEWVNFDGFYKDMGGIYKEGLTIDRIDNNGNYNKDNCRWVSIKEQQQNKSSNIIYKGKCLSEWIRELGLTDKVYKRINKYGWTIEKALELNN